MKFNKKYLILVILLPVQMVFMRIIANYPEVVERYYSNGIYPIISSFFRIVFGWIPFSVGDLLLASLLLLFIRFLYQLIKTRFSSFLSKLVKLVAIFSVIYFCFYLFWGLNYYREPLAKNLGYQQSSYSTEQLIKVTKHIVKKLNQCQFTITANDTLKVKNPYTQKEMYLMAMDGYKNLEDDFPQLKYRYKSVKNSLMSLLQSYNGVSGYLNPLTGEAHINDRIPTTSYPTTTCHEMAHQIGFAAENEANFVGFLAANYHDDVYFKYASYRMAFGYCIVELRKRDRKETVTIWKQVHKGIIKDYNESNAFWQAYKNPFEPIIKKGYSAYLKANKQEKGIASYNYVVDLLISYFESSNQKIKSDFLFKM